MAPIRKGFVFGHKSLNKELQMNVVDVMWRRTLHECLCPIEGACYATTGLQKKRWLGGTSLNPLRRKLDYEMFEMPAGSNA